MLKIIKLSIPISITQIGTTSFNLINTFLLGKYAPHQLVVLGAGNNIFWIFLIGGTSFLLAFDGLFAHASTSTEKLINLQGIGQFIALGLGLSSFFIMLIAGYLIAKTTTDPIISASIFKYLFFLGLSLTPTFAFLVLQKFAQTKLKAIPFTLILLFGGVLNVFFDIIFIHQLNFGASGVAISTLICRLIMLSLAYLYLIKNMKFSFKVKIQKIPAYFPQIIEISKLGLMASGQGLMEFIIIAILGFIALSINNSSISANQIAITISAALYPIYWGISSSATTIVGKKVSEGRIDDARKMAKKTVLISVTLATIVCIIVNLYATNIATLFNVTGYTLSLTSSLICLVGVYQIGDSMQSSCAALLRAYNITWPPFISNLVSYYFIGLPLGFFLYFMGDKLFINFWIGFATAVVFSGFLNLALSFVIMNRENKTIMERVHNEC